MRTAAFLLVLLAAPLAPEAHAQGAYGVRVGVNESTIRGFELPEGSETEPRLGLTAGIWGRHAFSRALGVMGELGYSQKGTRVTNPEDVDVTYALYYAEASALGRLALLSDPGLEIGAFAGPTFSVALDESVRIGDNPLPQSILNASDLGVAVGADVGAGPFGVDLRYTFGQWDLNRGGADLPDPEVDPEDWMNGAFTAAVRYRFGG